MRTLLLALALPLAACHRDGPPGGSATAAAPDRCTQFVDHFFSLIEATGKLGFTERLAIAAVKSPMADECRKEGLSQAQADCMLTLKKPDELPKLDDCPALKAHPLKWLSASSDRSGPDAGTQRDGAR
jgi:hypothetical protein